MARPRGRFGIPAMTPAEAFGIWLALAVLLGVLVAALNTVTDLPSGVTEWLMTFPVWGSLALVFLFVPRLPRRRH